MALQKNLTLNTGVIATYTRIKSLTKNIDLDRGLETIVSIEHFLTNDTSKDPLDLSQEYIIPVYSFTDAYIQLKFLEKYSEAQDC